MHHLTVRYYRVSSVVGSISSAFARCREHYCTQPRARVLRTSHARVLCSVSPRPAPCVAPMVLGRAVHLRWRSLLRPPTSSAFARCRMHYCAQPHVRVLFPLSPRPAPCVAPMVLGRVATAHLRWRSLLRPPTSSAFARCREYHCPQPHARVLCSVTSVSANKSYKGVIGSFPVGFT